MKLKASLLLPLLLALVHAAIVISDAAEPKVPAVYVFGDSTADVGNNNYLPGNDAKANFPHYGIDFPHSTPTGRFSNAYNGIDFLAINMGFKMSPPPYLSLTDKTSIQILKGLTGVNFASAGSGILDTTGTTITFSKQIEYFREFKSKIAAGLGTEKADYLLSKSIFLISSGGNDVFALFEQNPSPSSALKEQFYNLMTSNYEAHIKALFSLGARKFELVDVPMIGCCPVSRVQHPTRACLDGLNDLAKGVNDATKVLMRELSSTLGGMKYSIGSSYALISSLIAPKAAGYEEIQSACCGSGELNAQVMCSPNTTYCSHRSKYLFWDRIHPTHATSEKAGQAFYSGSLEYASPINLKQLVEDDI